MMHSNVQVELKVLNQGIHGQHLYDMWNDAHGQTGNYTRTTQKLKINLGTLGNKIGSTKPQCEVYLNSVTGFPDYELFPKCDLSKYDSNEGIFIDVNGTILANSTIILRLLGLKVEDATVSNFKA